MGRLQSMHYTMGQVHCIFFVKNKKGRNENPREETENFVKMRRDSTDSAFSSGSGRSPGSTLNDEVFEYSLEEHEDDAVVVYSNSSRPNTSSTNYSEKSKKRRKNNAWTAS